MSPIVKYKKLDPRAVVPTYATPGAAAADLSAVLDEVSVLLSALSPEEAAENAPKNTFVIGGGSVYARMLPYCREAIVTKVHAAPMSDTFFPNLDTDPGWTAAETLQRGEENGIAYEMVRYVRK